MADLFLLLDHQLTAALAKASTEHEIDDVERRIARSIEAGDVGLDSPAQPLLAPTLPVPRTPRDHSGVHESERRRDEAATKAFAAAEAEVIQMLDRASSWPLLDVHGNGADDLELVKVENSAVAPIDQALGRAQEVLAKQLQASGLASAIVSNIILLINLTADARVAQQHVVAKRAALATALPEARVGDPLVDGDPLEALSASEIAGRLGLSDVTIRSRERAGQLFSILRSGRKRGQEFPAFQAWTGIAGAPLEQTLSALVPPGGAVPVAGTIAYGFLTSPTDLLAGFAPIEMLLGRRLSSRAVDADADAVLRETPDVRIAYVVAAARDFASSELA